MRHLKSLQWTLSVFLLVFITLVSGVYEASAGCSPYIGRATVNEIDVHNQSGKSGPYFVEVKALDNSILGSSPPLWQNWTLDICSEPGDRDGSPCKTNIPIGSGLLQDAWLVIDQDIIQWDYLDLNDGNKHGMEMILYDENDDIVDYFTVDGYTVTGSGGCSFPYDTTYGGGNNFNLQREPDGIGDWESSGGGGSGDETENETNDPVPPGSPSLSITDASSPAGTPVVFTVTLSAAFTEDVTFSYTTANLTGTAVAGTDFTGQSGSVTIPAGEITATISVSTFLTANPNSYFYLSLTQVTTGNAQILNNVATGTILIAAVAEYRFDLCSETDVVQDASAFGFNGTVLNGPLAIETGKICNGANFDGVDDYVTIDDSDLFDDTSELTILGWINPEDIRVPPAGTNARGILSKRNNAASDVSYGIFFYSARADGKLYVDIDTTNNRFASNSTIAEGQWTHFAVTFNGKLPANERVKLYLNGSLDRTAREDSTTIPDYNSDLYLGNLYYGTAELKVYKGLMDEVNIIPAALSQSEILDFYNATRGGCQSCAQVDHYRFYHDGNALSCAPESIQVKACADTDCNSEYPGIIEATFSPSGWVGGDSQNLTSGAYLQLWHTTPEQVTLDVAGNSADYIALNPPRCFVSGVEQADCRLEFYDSGFVFDVPDLTACMTSPTITIQAVRTDDLTQTCVANSNFSNATTQVNFWSSYSNPNTGTEQLAVNGSNIATSSPGTGIPLSFDSTATASFTVNYPDAGQMQLDARYDGVGAEESGLVMLGNDIFVSRPVGFCVYSDDANSDCVAGNGSCSEFRKVDENFNLKVKAVCWESASDTDFCSGNATTPNYEQNNIGVTHTLVAPTSVGSASGNIGVTSFDMVDADNGEHVINNQTVSEVGVFTFTATAPDYFGVTIPAANSVNIGRFTPDHFITTVTANGAFENACSGFTYTGQTFGYDPLDRPEMTITATDSGGNTTVNYRDSFVKLTNPTTQISMPAVTADATTLGADAVTPLALSWSPAASSLVANDDGTLSFALGADDFTYTRNANALVAPFNSDIRLEVASITDSDGIVASDLSRFFNPTASEIRYGQLVLQNAYGPETLPLTLNLSAQYFNGTGFVNNNIDSCTPYDAAELGLSNWSGNLSSGDTLASSAVGLQLSAGLGTGMSLSAPGVGNDGSVDLMLDLSSASGLGLEWLRPGGVDPSAKATFGIYGGNQRLIYMRESVQ